MSPRTVALVKLAEFLDAHTEFDKVTYLIQDDVSFFIRGPWEEQLRTAAAIMHALGGSFKTKDVAGTTSVVSRGETLGFESLRIYPMGGA